MATVKEVVGLLQGLATVIKDLQAACTTPKKSFLFLEKRLHRVKHMNIQGTKSYVKVSVLTS